MAVTPLQAANDVLDRADALLILDSPPTPPSVREDIRRVTWALASASIDTFLHWRVARVTLDKGVLPKELGKLDVKFDDLVAMGRADLKARQDGRLNKPLVVARNVLNERILRDTYQSQQGVTKALTMCGVKDMWNKLATQMGETSPAVQAHV